MSDLTQSEWASLQFYWMKGAACYFPEMPNNGRAAGVHEWGEFMQRESSNFMVLLGIEGRRERAKAMHDVLTVVHRGLGADELNGRQAFIMLNVDEKPPLAKKPGFFLWDAWEKFIALSGQ